MGTVIDGVPVLMPPPEGYEVDFDNPQRQAVPEAYWIAGASVFLSLLFVAQRLYTKLVLMKQVQADDVFLILSCLISYSVVGLCIHMFASGAGGVHSWEISLNKYNIFLRDVYLAAAIYIIGGSFSKISLLIFYFRITPERWFAVANWATLLFIAGYTIGIFFAVVFACTPMQRNWDVLVTEGNCINQASLYIATAVVNIVSDVVIFCLPLPIVVKLQVPRRQKIGLVLIFLLGSLTLVTSCVRVSILPEMLTSLDQPWVISWASVWIIVEANLFLICASLPTMRKFLKQVAHSLIGESAYATSNGRSGYYANDGSTTRRGEGSTNLSQLSTTGRKRRYERFNVDEDLGTKDAYHDEAFEISPYNAGISHSSVSRGSHDGTILGDDGSERAMVPSKQIRQTTVVTVDRT